MREGVFWVLEKDEDKIKSGKFSFLYNFNNQRGHSDIWKGVIAERKDLSCYNYETFPRGRVWKSEASPIIFTSKKLNTLSVLQKIDELFALGGNYEVQEDE